MKKKTKKEKKVKTQKKSKMNGWLTALSVFAGVTAVSGITVLGVYLAGGFEEKVVMPESIEFVYDLDKFNEGQLEVGVNEPFNPSEKQTFTLKITSPTEKVTKNKVTLSFDGQDGFNTPDSMGYISNTVIRLPQVVTLGEEFEVELLTEDLRETENGAYVFDENNEHIDWIKGGISTLKAQSADIEQTPISLTVAVDVPVYKTQTQIVNSNGQITNKVVTNESFTVQSKFIPAKSEYMFSDDQSEKDESLWRVKRTFFESKNTTAITPVYDDQYTMHFVVGNEATSNIEIKGYTYQTAYSQIAIEKNLTAGSAINYYISMLENIAGNLTADKVATGVLSIGEANVDEYSITRQGTINMVADKDLRLFMNKFDYYENSDYLGVTIMSTPDVNSKRTQLDGLLKNIAIAFMNGETDATAGGNALISVKGGENASNYVVLDGIKYYKPTLSGSDPRYSFWDLTPIKEGKVQIKTVLFEEKDGTLKPFEDAGQVVNYFVNVEITKHKEDALAWTNSADIDVMLDYDDNGDIVPQTIDLTKLINVPTTNIYQDVIFFACFGTQDKIEYKELADSVLGASGYDYEKSGVYATENGNFTLFAIEGNKITLYNTGAFTLYYATVVTNNGGYQYDNDGLYQIAVMCQSSIRVTCEKSLNESSVTAGVLNTDNFVASESGEVSINQGSDLTFSVKFVVGKESVPVFEDEYNKDYMTPAIMDSQNNDITSYFIIDSESFVVDGETGNGLLEYKFKVKNAVQIENEAGIYFGYIALTYNDNHSKNLTWEYALGDEQIVCVYKPISISIAVNDEGGYEYGDVLLGKEFVKVEQTLQANSEFATTIKVKVGDIERTFASVAQFLDALIGANGARVVIVDQKGKTETLAGQWTFKVSGGDASIISISSDGKSFTFKNSNDDGNNVNLTITSADNRVSLADNGQNVGFSIISTGVTHIASANTLFTYDDTLGDKTGEIAKAVVRKYGAIGEAGEYITLKNLIKFYIGDGTEEYSNVNFKFNPQYVAESSLPDAQLLDLFGQEGMLTLFSDETTAINFNNDYTASNIRSILNSTEIYKIQINKNFAISPTLQFIVSDSISAVNTSLDLSLLANITVSAENYPASGNVLYAGREFAIANTVSNLNLGINNGTFANSLYVSGETYYVVYRNDRYVLTTETQEEGTYVALFSQGKIAFVDFWDVETKEFRVYFQPEGNNYYALNHGITFTVSRDLNIQSKNGTFYVLSTNISSPLEDYVSVTRKSDGSSIAGLTLDYSFSDYLNFDNGRVLKKAGADFFFDYNQQQLSSTLTIKLPSTGITLAQIPVNIKLYQTDDIYREFANAFSSKTSSAEETSITAQTQIVGDVEYMMVDTSNASTWRFGYLGSYYLKPSNKDNSNQIMNHAYEVSGVSDLTINFKSQNSLLAGLNNKSIYMVIKVFASKDASSALATVHVPMILSMLGYESVLYENDQIAVNHKLETALMTPEKLLENGIYNQITAGKLTQILKQYEYDQTVTESGLYTLSGFMQTLKYYAFDSEVAENYDELIKLLSTYRENNVSYGNLTLHHLAQSDKDVYLAIEYTLEKSDVGIKQTFYYLMKVVADIIVEDAVYAYDGNAEYFSAEKNQLYSLNLEEKYDEYTLNEGYKRFNVSKQISLVETSTQSGANAILDEVTVKVNSTSAKVRFTYTDLQFIATLNNGENTLKLSAPEYFDETLSARNPLEILIMEGDAEIYYNGEKVFASLKYKNEIASVKVGDNNAVTSESDWSKDVDLSFSPDFATLYYRAKIENKIEILIKHSYVGSSNETDLAVVGGEQYYKIILNGSASNYTVRFIENGEKEISTEYVVNLDNGNVESYDLTILLIQNDQAGASNEGTIVPDLLNMQITEGGEYIENFTYDRSTGAFNVKLLDYIETDKKVYFAIYTEQGYLARLVLSLKANAQFALKEGMDKLTGGTNVAFADIFTITRDGQEATDFAVEAMAKSGDVEFVKWLQATSSIEIADLIADKSVSFDFVVTFDDGNKFIFSYDFTLKANIKTVSSFTSSQKVTAGQTHQLELASLYSGTLSKNSAFAIEVASSNPAFESLSKDGDKWIVKTTYVSASVTVSLNLTISINYGEVSQKYSVVYAFVVEPSVQITSNYPVPNDSQLTFEYIEDGTTYQNVISNFFAHAPIFGNADQTRIVIKNGDSAGVYDKSVDYTTLSPVIIVSNLQNASVKYADGHYEVNSAIANDANITFYRGTYNRNTGIYADAGTDAYVEFTITYQEVSQVYKVYILKNAISVKLNFVSNYTGSGDFESETVNYETIYIDKTSSENLFDGERMVMAEMSDEMANYANEYYLVFTDGSDYFASYPTFFSAKDQSKDLYFDLGYSMSGKTFVGAYLTSTFETVGLGANYNSAITVNTDRAEKNATVEGLISSLQDFSQNLFDRVNITLANRVQLVYGQLNGKDILVDFEWYKSSVNKIDVTDAYEIDNIYKASPLSTFARNDGSNTSIEFAVNYFFKPSIDIDVAQKVNSAFGYVQLEVNQENLSMASVFGVHHPTTGRLISASDFATGTTTLSLKTINYLMNDGNEIADDYLKHLKLNEFKTTSDGDPNNLYLFCAEVLNASKHISDYTLLPLGAKNAGDFVLCELIYSSGEFAKTFYLVVKIMPDYIVKFGESVDNATTEEDGSISNINNIKTISEVEEITVQQESSVASKVVFADFALTGENGHISIKHKNGTSTDVEFSSRYFDITMPIGYRYESTEYNNENNIKEKIFYEGDALTGTPNLVTENGDGVWTLDGDEYVLKTGKDAKYTMVNQIIFGDQYYMIRGVDPYGYVFKVYFILQAVEATPNIEGTVSLVENGYFDVGVQYQNLSIEEDSGFYQINRLPVVPTANDGDVKMINIQGIEAWLFNKEYDKEGLLIARDPSVGGYDPYVDEESDVEIVFDESNLQYLEMPKLNYISIESIKFYDPQDSNTPLATLAMPEFGSEDSQFATAEAGTGFFNGMKTRGPYSTIVTDENGDAQENKKLWRVPRLENTDIYEGTNTADIVLIITLKYEQGGMIEYYDCPVQVNLIREISIEETDENIARDGQSITLTQQFKVPYEIVDADGSSEDINLVDENATFTNDTLEVLVKANDTASFEMTLSRGGNIISNASVTASNTGKSYDKTEYISLSQYFGANVKEGDIVSINNAQNATFFYITKENTTGALNGATSFVIGNIENDYIYIENADLISLNSYYNVKKYYVMNCTIEGSSFSYQVERTYAVTGYYYKSVKEFIREIGFTINDADKDKTISLADWRNGAFTLREAINNQGVIEEASEENADINLSYLRFSIDSTTSTIDGMTIGNAEIDEKTGTITLGDSFTESQYIKVVLQMAVSGKDRNIDTHETGDAYHYLGTLNLSTERTV